MKKTVLKALAVTAAATIAGSAFAEIQIKEQARIRTAPYAFSKPADGDSVHKLWNLKNSSAADYLDFYASNEYAGVGIESVIDADATTSPAITFDTYYGYLQFGSLKFTFGNYDSRFTNRYNVTATEAGLLDSDFAKFGLSNKLVNGVDSGKETKTYDWSDIVTTDTDGYEQIGSTGAYVKVTSTAAVASKATVGKTWLYDFGNAAQSGGSGENLSLLVDYTLNDILGGKLLLKGGFLENAYDKTSTFIQSAGYIVEAAWQGENNTVDLIFKNPTNKAFGGGAYVTTKPIDGLAAVLGFTIGTQSDVIDLAFAVDGRLQYIFNDKARATLVAKYSSLKADEDGAKTESGLELGTEISYVVNDTVTLAFDARLDYVDLDDNDKKDVGENSISISPRVKLSAGSAAAITAAVEFTQAFGTGDAKDEGLGAAAKTSLAIPVIFRVKL